MFAVPSIYEAEDSGEFQPHTGVLDAVAVPPHLQIGGINFQKQQSYNSQMGISNVCHNRKLCLEFFVTLRRGLHLVYVFALFQVLCQLLVSCSSSTLECLVYHFA
ncbi:hypothetical protein M5689_011924 [Euphorbia peplus]|nr:hypothetical protein M5689_011924 [Euphorbia peplus]